MNIDPKIARIIWPSRDRISAFWRIACCAWRSREKKESTNLIGGISGSRGEVGIKSIAILTDGGVMPLTIFMYGQVASAPQAEGTSKFGIDNPAGQDT
jgi:hypothetical protein